MRDSVLMYISAVPAACASAIIARAAGDSVLIINSMIYIIFFRVMSSLVLLNAFRVAHVSGCFSPCPRDETCQEDNTTPNNHLIVVDDVAPPANNISHYRYKGKKI